MKRKIFVYKHYFWDFLDQLDPKTQKKVEFVLQLVQTLDVIPKQYFKHVSGTDGLYEIRVQVGNNIYRIFCFFDKGKLVILLNGFQKKSQKTPKREIALAEKLKKEYESEKSQ
ncbi:MAG: type II toxin-antitoxin system RelE/ParE family toxin [Bacteroidota bacterium]